MHCKYYSEKALKIGNKVHFLFVHVFPFNLKIYYFYEVSNNEDQHRINEKTFVFLYSNLHYIDMSLRTISCVVSRRPFKDILIGD